MKLLTLAIELTVLPTYASAQTTTYRDWMGREVGTATTDRGVTTFRDRMGRETGTAQRQSGGRTIYRDRMGRETGTASSPRR